MRRTVLARSGKLAIIMHEQGDVYRYNLGDTNSRFVMYEYLPEGKPVDLSEWQWIGTTFDNIDDLLDWWHG